MAKRNFIPKDIFFTENETHKWEKNSTLFRPVPSTSYRFGENLEVMDSRFNIINMKLLTIKSQTLVC